MNCTPSVLVLHTKASANEAPKLLVPLRSLGFVATEFEIEEGSCVQTLAQEIESASFASVVVYREFGKVISWDCLNPANETFPTDLRDELGKLVGEADGNISHKRSWLPFSGQFARKRA